MPLLTLEAVRKHGLFQPQDRSNLPLQSVLNGMRGYYNSLSDGASEAYRKKTVGPETQAVSFYVLNDMAARAKGLSPAEEDLLARAYFECVSGQVIRMVSYLILICSRESRHLNNKFSVMKEYPSTIKQHHSEFSGSTQTMEYMLSDKNDWGDVTFGQYAYFLEHVFFDGSYAGGFGGTKWGYIGRLLNQYVSGKLSGELMLDQAYTLCHNNGPIFNKGMLYEMYSSKFTGLLDKQHAGTLFDDIESGSPKTYWEGASKYSRYDYGALRTTIAPKMTGTKNSDGAPGNIESTNSLPAKWTAALSEHLPKPLAPLDLGPLVGQVPQYKISR